jgi:hypothetical protein
MTAPVRFLSLSCLLAALFITGCAAPAGGEWPRKGVVSPRDANPRYTTMPAETLDLRVGLERDTALVGEPVYLTLRLTNTGPREISVIGSLDPSDGGIDILVTPSDGKPAIFVPLSETDNDVGLFKTLRPGETIGAVVPVFFGANGWTFSVPGRYRIEAHYHTPADDGRMMETASAPLDLRVEATPDGSGAFLIGKGEAHAVDAGKFLLWQAGDHLTEGQAHLRATLERWPGSPLSHAIHSAFGNSYGKRFANYLEKAVRPPDCRRAMDHLQRVSDDRIPEFLRVQNAITRARCAVLEGEPGAAAEHTAALKQLMGDRPEYRQLVLRLEPLFRHVEAAPR